MNRAIIFFIDRNIFIKKIFERNEPKQKNK